jgi:hypothetical protein
MDHRPTTMTKKVVGDNIAFFVRRFIQVKAMCKIKIFSNIKTEHKNWVIVLRMVTWYC